MVDKYYQYYGSRAREPKKYGKRIMGYLCAFVPVEMLTAAGFIPFRIKGYINEPITKADAEMETIVCPLVRSCFDIGGQFTKGCLRWMRGAGSQPFYSVRNALLAVDVSFR
jgi:benzoyl-CoA reductase/2-hydroxyglutaryl-CoA dehydratase subunit BcrC/BadD/HgdB